MMVSELMLVLAVAAATALLALLMLRPSAPTHAPPPAAAAEPLALLFDDTVLHHATQRALSRFSLLPGTHVWEDLRVTLLPRFPGFPKAAGPGAEGSMSVISAARDDPSCVEITWRDGLCWVEIVKTAASAGPEAESLRQVQQLCCDTMPAPVWEVLPSGRTGWRNAAYDQLRAAQGIADDQPLFALTEGQDLQRQRLETAPGQTNWYEIRAISGDSRKLWHATPITDLVRCEQAQNALVQTLSGTFANLDIGLAIFDREGRLAIFNPALVELTGLSPALLAARPGVLSFFDALREHRRMPEPKNYGSWRQQIADMVRAASDGSYSETWTLEDGRTYAVQGRPHPDGATAFQIEDISSEITLSRNFRVEMTQYEQLLDAVEDALVVFSGTGILTFCNAAYRALWRHNPDAAFADVTLADAIDLWRDRLCRTAEREALGRIALGPGARDGRRMTLQLSDGERLVCHVLPLGPEATLVRFARQDRQDTDSKAKAKARG